MNKTFNIELIHPVEPKSDHHAGAERQSIFEKLVLGRLTRKSLSSPPLGLLRIATATPTHVRDQLVNVRIVDEAVEKIDIEKWQTDARPDLVGVLCMTATLERTRVLVGAALENGIPVVVGGPHASLRPEELLQTGVAVVSTRGETVWPGIVEEAATGKLANKVYADSSKDNLKGVTRPPSHFFDPEKYFTVNVLGAGDGCPYTCSFCSTKLIKGNYVGRDVDEIKEEIDGLVPEHGMVVITDDQFFMHRQADEIIRHLGQRGHSWFATVSSLFTFKNGDLIKLAGQNGCKIIYLGYDELEGQQKGLNKNKGVDWHELLANIRSSGITPSVGFVLGLGEPTLDELKREAEGIRRFAAEHQVAMIHLGNSVPYPGTQEYDLKGDRIFRPTSEFDTQGPVTYEPRHMSPDTFDRVYYEMAKDIYSIPNVLARLRSVPGIKEKAKLFFYNLKRWQHISSKFPHS